MMVLRIGFKSTFLIPAESQCHNTATSLFYTARVFVLFSIAAWVFIIIGYIIPFCIIAIMLRRNGYLPPDQGQYQQQQQQQRQQQLQQQPFGLFPLRARTGAPPTCIDQMKIIRLEDFGEEYPRECCVSFKQYIISLAICFYIIFVRVMKW